MPNTNYYAQLSPEQKAELFKLYAASGFTSLSSIIDDYNKFKNGGDIHIKESHRGRFTDLVNRTGKSASWYKEHGTPAQRKMATFALNARKWKHSDGGNLFDNGGDPDTLNNPMYNAGQEQAMWDYLIGQGLNEYQAAGLLGNMAVESYLNADIKQRGGTAYGLIQAEGDRQTAMRNYADTPYLFGSDLSDEEQQQLDYVVDKGIKHYTPGEWGRKGFNGARDARRAFLNVNDVNTASDIITNNYLRPGKPHLERRRNMSNYYYNKYVNPYSIKLKIF